MWSFGNINLKEKVVMSLIELIIFIHRFDISFFFCIDYQIENRSFSFYSILTLNGVHLFCSFYGYS